MTCEEFAMAGLDLGVNAENGLQEAARQHLRDCPHCAALQENWEALRADLRALGEETRDVEAPSRVEMRLRQEFRTRHKTLKAQRAAWLVGWSVAAAAVLIAALAWISWHRESKSDVARQQTPQVRGAGASTNTSSGQDANLVASNSSGEFTLLPGSMPGSLEDTTVVRVRMQRGALEAFGLPVSEERAADWIQVDLLVGDDGQPQAVRLPQSN